MASAPDLVAASLGCRRVIEDDALDADAVGPRRLVQRQEVLPHGLEVELSVPDSRPGAVEAHAVAVHVEGRGRQLRDLAVQRAHRHKKIDRRAVGMGLVGREAAAPGPPDLGIDEAQLGVGLVQRRIGVAHGIAHGAVHERAPRQEPSEAVGTIVSLPNRGACVPPSSLPFAAVPWQTLGRSPPTPSHTM